MNASTFAFLPVGLIASVATAVTGSITTAPEKIPTYVADWQELQIPNPVHQNVWWVETRIAANGRNRLVKIDPARLLAGNPKQTFSYCAELQMLKQ